jgi:hypothetical protein
MARFECRGDADWLDGRPVENGSHLELRLPRGHWLPGRYERDAQDDTGRLLRVVLGGAWEDTAAARGQAP